MGKNFIKFLEDDAVSRTVLGGLTVNLVANILQYNKQAYVCDKNYENWFTVDQVIA